MKFLKLEMLNLASLDREGGEVINFEEGALRESSIFSIVGITGSGKSTILDAICLALYNRAPRYPRRPGDRRTITIYGEVENSEKNRLDPLDCRNILTRGKRHAYSKLTFLANNGIVYRAEWSIQKGPKRFENAITSLVRIEVNDGKTIEVADEWKKIPEIIGRDYEQFLRTVLIAQGSFANFLKANENERYELLEKLVGCGEIYGSIADRIKEEKDKATQAFDEANNLVAARQNYIIADEELAALKAKITELQDIETKALAELDMVNKAIDWYVSKAKQEQDIANFQQAFDLAYSRLEAIAEQTERLALYDSSRAAIDIYKAVVAATANVASLDGKLKSCADSIDAKEKEIASEKVNLTALQTVATQADAELAKQKPHINKAREIKAELDGLKKTRNEKSTAKTDAEKAKTDADKALADNQASIKSADKALQSAQSALAELKADIQKDEAEKKQQADEAVKIFNAENTKLAPYDATKLQDAKSLADSALTDIKSAIRIRKALAEKQTSLKSNQEKQSQLTTRNTEIAGLLKSYDLDKLSKEVETLRTTYTLMTSENWEQHRADLANGQPCPLCGSTDHPYHTDENVVPVINDLKTLVDEKEAELRKQRAERDELSNEQAGNSSRLGEIKTTIEGLETEIKDREAEWHPLHEAHPDWPEDVDALSALVPDIQKDASDADAKLKEYNTLVKSVDQLRKKKEKAEKALQDFRNGALEKQQKAEQKVTDANTLLQTEKGKTDNLQKQANEKQVQLQTAADALSQAEQAVKEKSDALQAEIGDKDPDKYETELSDAKTSADKAVNDKKEQIFTLGQQLSGFKSEESAFKTQKEGEVSVIQNKNAELDAWLASYNDAHADAQLSRETVATISTATDKWEDIRKTKDQLTQAHTAAKTTLDNGKKALEKHLESRPAQSEEELRTRQAELNSRSNDELVNSTARLQNHNDAVQQLGPLFDAKQKAEELKLEWEQIIRAIGADGSILRKIAQCYTLRFLVEHANAEIRKFNSRYELQQVKNSLAIRVIDHDRADDVRDITSLSGGETFIVSLGLALGLSSLSSGSISFGNLFIDEGFGSLDPETLATVIDSLAMLQLSQGKKVGVISHTDTMSERITTQIRVIKNGNSGSSHIEIYPG